MTNQEAKDVVAKVAPADHVSFFTHLLERLEALEQEVFAGVKQVAPVIEAAAPVVEKVLEAYPQAKAVVEKVAQVAVVAEQVAKAESK